MKPLVLEGSRLRLEPLETGHLDELCRIGLDPELWRYTTIRVESEDDMAGYIAKALREQEEGTCISFVIRLKQSNEIVGTTRFHHIACEHKRCEIGFTWFAAPHLGSGLNQEAKQLMLDHAFEVWRFNRVEFRADADNLRSRRALEKIGARLEAVLRSYVQSAHRGPRDVVVYGIVREDWLSLSS